MTVNKMRIKLCQCCASKLNLNTLTSRYAKILESIFSLKIEELYKSYICNNCISILIDTEIFRKKIDRTQKAIQAKIFELNNKKQTIPPQRKSNIVVGRTIKVELATKSLTESSNIASVTEPEASIKYEENNSDSGHDYDTISDPVESDTLPPSAQNSVSANEIYAQFDKNTLICRICHEQQLSYTLLTRHMNLHYPNYVCETCGKGFMTGSRLSTHVKIHNPIPQECNICGIMFRNANTLMSHRQTKHLGKHLNKCQICGERFYYRYAKMKHLADVHGQTEKKYKCHQCVKTFLTASLRASHFSRKHRLAYKHICEVCGRSYADRKILDEHMTSHTGERPFQCAKCPKSYPRKKTLREHMRIHDNDRRFSCEVCGRAFIQKCSLKGHMKVHEKNPDKLDNV